MIRRIQSWLAEAAILLAMFEALQLFHAALRLLFP
jgi:hypothetical protein